MIFTLIILFLQKTHILTLLEFFIVNDGLLFYKFLYHSKLIFLMVFFLKNFKSFSNIF